MHMQETASRLLCPSCCTLWQAPGTLLQPTRVVLLVVLDEGLRVLVLWLHHLLQELLVVLQGSSR
jgi:hypothetical protein